MRISGGRARGHIIRVPQGVSDLRPAQEKVRQAVFNYLASHFESEDPKVLDLFAGTGAFGIEALSRGAVGCVFVEQNKKATATLKKTLRHSHFLGKAKVICQDARRFVGDQPPHSFDLIFLDPPYRLKMDSLFLAQVGDLLKEGGLLIYSHAKKSGSLGPADIPKLKTLDTRIYGGSAVTFLTREN